MPAYNRQLKDKDDNLIYPVLNSDSIPGNAVTTAKIADGAVTSAKIGTGEVKATNIDFSTLSFGNYSTSEVDTGFTWIDGSHIYKKTFSNTFTGSSNTISVSSLNINVLVDWKNTVFAGTSQHIVGSRLGASGGTDSIMLAVQYRVQSQDLLFEFGSNYSSINKTVYTTIWYTKAS